MLIRAGHFDMGRDRADPMGYDPELPRHQVTIGKPFYLARYETTQVLWRKVMGDNPANFQSWDRPVENVSFDDVQQFLKQLNKMTKQGRYRLPSEAEWEYAARAGSNTAYFFGANPGVIDSYGWYIGNTPGGTQPVGKKRPNAWGLYDMAGNIAEWVEDCWHENYDGAPNDGSAWLGSRWFNDPCKERVLRGGSWFSPAFELRSAYRFKHFRFNRSQHKGFRLVFEKR